MFAKESFDLIVGVDSDGIIEGRRYAERFGIPLAYLSFEIFFRDELTTSYERRRKEQESDASRAADLVIIQDDERAKLLASENGLETWEIRSSAGLTRGRRQRPREPTS